MSTLQQVLGLMQQAIIESYNENERNDAVVLAQVRGLMQQMQGLVSEAIDSGAGE
ncbi:hypothetical protein [Paludibacterium purpuratum]|uniref:Uncharacterized protein n=1 Tax=Paludibacterium purpuratum TaxID=1144873 RepID=A0A4R7B399_9NEIS|nr:hypothetical protein [Paludibacterium purpuratum]TDR76483.1 hypothetical protein DFP86_11166 [Paludibacterium purpuratum]